MLLLALFATAWSTQAWADVTINVKAPSAPHMYVWNSSQTPLNGQWPGDVVTDTKVVNGETYYTKTISNESTVSVIFAKDNSTQTGDFSGLTGEVFFHYDGETLAYGDLPDDAIYEPSGDFLYFVNSKNWSTVNCHVFNGNSTSTEVMTYIGNDKAGQKVYKWGPKSNLGFVPTNVIFNNGSWASQGGVETPSHSYSNGGYYVYSETNNGSNKRLDLVAVIDASRIKNTSTYFNDTHFREGITRSLGVAEGAAFTPADYTILDLSYDSETMTGKISDLSGIEHFTNLEELDISNNSIPYGDITALTKLKKIVAIGNPQLQGFGVNAPSASNKILRISSSSVLEYVDVSNTAAYYLTALNNNCGSTLKTLIAANNPTFDYSTFTGCSALEYLDLSNCGLTRDALNKTHFEGAGGANLKYIDVSNNSNLYNLYVIDKAGLETIIMKNCTAYDYGSFDYCPNLKHADFSGCTALASDMWNHLKPEIHTQLQYLNLSNGTTNVNGHTFSFPALDTLIINNHGTTLTQLNINTHSPSIIDITNDTHLANLAITNSGLTQATMPTITATGATSLYKLDLTNNAFTDVPTTGILTLTTLVMNNNQLSDINVSESNIHYLYAQNNNFSSVDYTLPTTSLVGLDLCNNGFTKFKAENNTSLKSLALAGNTALTEIELHGNSALTQTSPDGVIESDNGLYIKGLSSLQTLNIENSSFNKLGQQSSLEGCTGLTKLQARHNEFTTFTNGVYALDVSNSGNYRIPDPTESSLEHLTALEYLDLAYNELCDSVHLYKNVALKHLDVSHNNHITGVYDGTITTNAQKQAMIEKKGRHLMKYGQVKFLVNGEYKKKTYGTNVTPEQWEQHYGTTGETNLKYQIARERPFDLRECDLNDTTGLYHLDLGHNVNLEYLDFSYTNIHNTASGPTYMLSGWMDKDWVTDQETLSAIVKPNSSTYRAHSSFHTYVYIIPCSKLKVIHADHNNMQSFGFFYFPKLDTLTISYMYGDCAFMRDVPQTIDYSIQNPLRYNMGGCGLSGSVRKLSSITWGTTLNDAGETITTANLKYVYKDEGDTENYKNPTEFFDVSNSGYNEVRLNNAVSLEYVDVSGNPLNFQVIHEEKDENGQTFVVNNEDYSYYNSLDVTYSPNIRTVKAENCSDLPTVRAHNRTKLDTLYLSNDPKLKTLYIQNDPLLKTNFEGLNTLTGLETLFAYNNTQWGGIDVASNTALKNLWVSNIGASAIDVSKNTLLEKLRVYDNSLEALNVASNPALTWLDLARNQVPELDLSHNTALQYFNCSNSEETLDDQSLAADNHNGGDADEVKPVTSNHSASHTGNSLSDLVFNTSAPVADVRANSNDLHKISGNFTNLTNIEFAHNHINGIDLSAATGTPNINSEDNGRAITAECAKFYQQGQFNPLNEITVFYFQLEDINANGQPPVDNSQPLASKTSEDSKGTTRHLGQDGFILDELKAWNSSNSAVFIPTNPSGISPKDVTVEPSNMNQYLAEVPGTIVVLKEDPEHPGEGRATYTYNNGKGESEFYLDWTADSSVPTAIENMKIIEGLNIVNTTDGLTVTGADGTVVGVYDLNGRLVASEAISGGTLTIDGLAPGIYVVNGVKVVVK